MKKLAYKILKSASDLSIIGMRLEHDFVNENVEDRLVFLLMQENVKYELSFFCGNVELREVNSWIGITHLAKRKNADQSLNKNVYQLSMTNNTECDYFCVVDGIAYYNKDMLIKKSNRGYDNPPVLIFHGDSNAQKSYIGAIIRNYNNANVVETDAYLNQENLIKDLRFARVVVVGNKFDISVDFVKKHVKGEIIDVSFKTL